MNTAIKSLNAFGAPALATAADIFFLVLELDIHQAVMMLLYRKRRHTNIFCVQEGSVVAAYGTLWAVNLHVIPLPREALLSWGMRLLLSILRAGGLGPVCVAPSLELSPPFWPLGESCQCSEMEVCWEFHGSSQQEWVHRPMVRRGGKAWRGALLGNTRVPQVQSRDEELQLGFCSMHL